MSIWIYNEGDDAMDDDDAAKNQRMDKVVFHRTCIAKKQGLHGTAVLTLGFPGGSDSKESAMQWRPGFNSWVRKILWRRG